VFGHENIQATHRATFEFTKDCHVTQTGDCIVGIKAEKSLPELSDEFKEKLRTTNAKLIITVEVDGIAGHVIAFGSPKLTLTHASDMVVRKSSHIDSRTLAIGADKAARDLSREIIKKLHNPDQKAKITLTITT
jgi:hypothetical protein